MLKRIWKALIIPYPKPSCQFHHYIYQKSCVQKTEFSCFSFYTITHQITIKICIAGIQKLRIHIGFKFQPYPVVHDSYFLR